MEFEKIGFKIINAVISKDRNEKNDYIIKIYDTIFLR